MSIARWIMDRAVANPPAGREDWARAMDAEFEALEEGRICWALGCWRTMAGWRLRADWRFMLSLVAVPWLMCSPVAPLALFGLSIVLPRPLFYELFLPLGLLGLASAATLLAHWRPDRAGTAALSVWIVSLLHGWFVLQMSIGDTMTVSDGVYDRWELYNAPPLVGGLAMLAACWIGAQIGVRLGRYSRRVLSA